MSLDATDPRAYWQRLRRDKRSNIAVGAVLISGIAIILAWLDIAFPGGRAADRLSLLYWVTIVAFAWWGSALGGFRPWAARLLKPAALMLPIMGGVALFLAWQSDHAVWLTLAAFGIATIGSALCLVCLKKSLLKREGADRR